LAALGEEVVYRGYLQLRAQDLLGAGRSGLIASILVTSTLFGIAHLEQGVIGVVVTFLDGILFSVLRARFGNCLWASVLAHGFNNTIGLVKFFFVGPIYGLW
jgi:hypothetical protein